MTDEIIEQYGDDLETITLIRGGKGRFEVTVDGQEVYSKARTKRHANPGEVIDLMKEIWPAATVGAHSDSSLDHAH